MPKIADMLAEGKTFSLEFMPPKNDEMLRQFEKTLRELEPLNPSFCSVTYGAGGSTRDRTLDAVLHVHNDTPLVAMPHLTCVGQTRDDIQALVDTYHRDGIENLLALAGDPPLEGKAEGDFTYAIELIDLARATGDFSIGVAAFPEGHPKSSSRDEDLERLIAKLEVADFAITQFFWEPDHYFRLRDALAKRGIRTPVLPSVMPVVSDRVRDMTRSNGAEWPAWLAEKFESARGDAAALRQLGIDVATEIGRRLIEEDVPGLHLYTLNRSSEVREVWANLEIDTRR